MLAFSSMLTSFHALECGLLEALACVYHLFVSVTSKSHTSSVKYLMKKSKAVVLSVKCIVGPGIFAGNNKNLVLFDPFCLIYRYQSRTVNSSMPSM